MVTFHFWPGSWFLSTSLEETISNFWSRSGALVTSYFPSTPVVILRLTLLPTAGPYNKSLFPSIKKNISRRKFFPKWEEYNIIFPAILHNYVCYTSSMYHLSRPPASSVSYRWESILSAFKNDLFNTECQNPSTTFNTYYNQKIMAGLLAANTPSDYSTTRHNPSICNTQLYITVTF